MLQEATGTSQPPLPGIQTRWLLRKDMPDVMRIENASFDRPWTTEEFLNTLRHRKVIALVAIGPKGEILGYVVYELARHRIDIINLAVAPESRRRGVGSMLAETVKGRLQVNRRNAVRAVVSDRNVPAQLLLKACGFRCIHIDPDFYDTPDHGEAYVFRFCRVSDDEKCSK